MFLLYFVKFFSLVIVFLIAAKSARSSSLSEQLKLSYLAYCPETVAQSLPTDVIAKNNFSSPLVITVDFVLYRFIEIHDLQQRLSLFALLSLNWENSCPIPTCRQLLGEKPICDFKEMEGVFFFLTGHDLSFWRPQLIHYNAFEKAWIIQKLGGNFYWIYPFQETQIYWEAYGRFDTHCESFSFRVFPFDSLNCSIIFDSSIESNVNSVKIRRFEIDPLSLKNFVSDSDIWEFIPPLVSSVAVNQQYDKYDYHRIYFHIKFKRKTNFYLCKILIPTFAIFALQIVCLIMPPNEPDRPVFSITVVLASAFTLAMVYESIPQTSEPVYFVYMLMTKFCTGVAITLYSLIICNVSIHLKPKSGNQQNNTVDSRKRHILLMTSKLIENRTIDLAFGLFAFFVVVVSDLTYFSLMFNQSN